MCVCVSVFNVNYYVTMKFNENINILNTKLKYYEYVSIYTVYKVFSGTCHVVFAYMFLSFEFSARQLASRFRKSGLRL